MSSTLFISTSASSQFSMRIFLWRKSLATISSFASHNSSFDSSILPILPFTETWRWNIKLWSNHVFREVLRIKKYVFTGVPLSNEPFVSELLDGVLENCKIKHIKKPKLLFSNDMEIPLFGIWKKFENVRLEQFKLCVEAAVTIRVWIVIWSVVEYILWHFPLCYCFGQILQKKNWRRIR